MTHVSVLNFIPDTTENLNANDMLHHFCNLEEAIQRKIPEPIFCLG